ncbi:uncharacterized protein N7498_005233 [Penicillium cinerascens]|uniref:Uncharacterized protein n=1 Tax=Penicillium cinerascens TaxID=70096 RepID=A0A9W9MN76_9EURO|nr:uncharacterized protein N7498_005233 [Penicillium cinerascens]KAJ5204354.1 hypothetical protein N7498_005233 [Penicillium cinerascens]
MPLDLGLRLQIPEEMDYTKVGVVATILQVLEGFPAQTRAVECDWYLQVLREMLPRVLGIVRKGSFPVLRPVLQFQAENKPRVQDVPYVVEGV